MANPRSLVVAGLLTGCLCLNLNPVLAADAKSTASPRVERIWLTHQSPDNSKIVVSWETTVPGDSVVEFGTSPQLGATVSVAGSRTLHHVEIPLASKDVVYHYRVRSGAQVSPVHTFKGYPTRTLRIAVVANIRADAKLVSDAETAATGQRVWI